MRAVDGNGGVPLESRSVPHACLFNYMSQGLVVGFFTTILVFSLLTTQAEAAGEDGTLMDMPNEAAAGLLRLA